MIKYIEISFCIRALSNLSFLSVGNFRTISGGPLRHPIPAYLTLARLNGLDDDGYRKAIHATQKSDLVISGV